MSLVRDARAALGNERLVLSIHDASFPSAPDEDIGVGSPYTRGAEDFFRFAEELGFDAVALGPQGHTSPSNPSPYDGTVFSKNVLALPLAVYASEGLLDRVDDLVAGTPPGDTRTHREHAFVAAREALVRAGQRLAARPDLVAQIDAFAATSPWAVHDARYEAFAPDAFWPPPHAPQPWILAQWLLHREHRALRERLGAIGLRLIGDLQIGLSMCDRWEREALFFPGFVMGAPPSRTNPDGQPWGYPVLDPRGYAGPTLDFARARFEKIFAEFDGVRIDHPHGLVCPWVYEPGTAVAEGARLFETPTGVLASVAIARPDQIDPDVAPYADHRVRRLDAEQIDRYAVLFDLLMETARALGRSSKDVVCEVLSTCPLPLAYMLERHDLGRMRVTQKASMTDPHDVYRAENASPRDWAQLGNHDTEPIRRVIDRWTRDGALAARAAYLASRLEPDAARRDAFARWVASAPGHVATAMLADLFVGPAENVLLFWPDLFGEHEIYNRPGVVDADNWTMRVPRAFRSRSTLDLPSALAIALRARGVAEPLRAALAARAAVSPP